MTEHNYSTFLSTPVLQMNSHSAVAAAYDRHASIDELDRAIVTLASRINAATYDLLVLVRRFDERTGWLGWGFQSCAEWLHYRCDISLSAAREKVRVAHALKTLPSIGRAFAEGRRQGPRSGARSGDPVEGRSRGGR